MVVALRGDVDQEALPNAAPVSRSEANIINTHKHPVDGLGT